MNNKDMISQNYHLHTRSDIHTSTHEVIQDISSNNNHVHSSCQSENTQPLPGNLHTSSCFILKTVIKISIVITIFQMTKLRLRVQTLFPLSYNQ